MSKRIKAPSLATRDEFNATATRVADIYTQLQVLKARQARAEQRVKAAYAAKRKPLEDEMKAKLALAAQYASANRSDLLPDEEKRKSGEAGASQFGFSLNPPSTETLSKWTWEKVVAAMREEKLNAYLAVEYAVAKAKILADGKDGCLFNDDGVEVRLSEVGLKIAQEEVFYIIPKPSGVGALTVEAAAA